MYFLFEQCTPSGHENEGYSTLLLYEDYQYSLYIPILGVLFLGWSCGSYILPGQKCVPTVHLDRVLWHETWNEPKRSPCQNVMGFQLFVEDPWTMTTVGNLYFVTILLLLENNNWPWAAHNLKYATWMHRSSTQRHIIHIYIKQRQKLMCFNKRRIQATPCQ